MTEQPDGAAILGASVSLYKAGNDYAKLNGINLSGCYSGGDEWMRQVYRCAVPFETWACAHVDFSKIPGGDVWPYLLEDKFGDIAVKLFGVMDLDEWDERHCVMIAVDLKLTAHLVSPHWPRLQGKTTGTR